MSVECGITIKQMLKVLKKSKESVNWEVVFINKSIHKQVSIFNETLMMIGTPLEEHK